MENYDEAEEQLQRALSISEDVLGPNDPLLAENLRQLGFLYQYLWRPKDAREVLNRAVAIEETRGSDHSGLAASLDGLAITLMDLERHEEAIATLERALNIRRKIVSPDHPTIARTLQRLGLAYSDLRGYDQAEKYLLKALAIREARLGPMHPATGFTVGALGEAYTEQGRLEDAERMLTRSLAIMRDAHPEEHGNVSYEKYSLAKVHRKRGQLDEAERLTRDAIENWSNTIRAEDNQSLLDGQWQLANIYRDQARYDKAAKIYARTFAAYEQEDHVSSDWARELADEYAAFLRLRGQDVEADALFKRLRP
jgi:tetratricopeptide (TPR) repeat protein